MQTMRATVTALATALLVATGGIDPGAAQGVPATSVDLPLAEDLGVTRGQTVTPVYEGWYPTPDGTYALSFGYFNRNTEEVVHIPVGPNNRVEGGPDRGQPTWFFPGRHWGVFAIEVPGDFDDELVWTVQIRDKTFEIPTNVIADWRIDAISGDAEGNTPPRIRFTENGPEGQGPLGITADPRTTSVGSPVSLTVWARDDGITEPDEEPNPVFIRWLPHRGPARPTFSQARGEIPIDGGQLSTDVTFSEAGTYTLRVFATDQQYSNFDGHAQCCWTNGFVEVTVTE